MKKLMMIVATLCVSNAVFADGVNCFWVESNSFKTKKGLESLHVAASSISANIEKGTLVDATMTSVSITQRPITIPANVISFGIYDSSMTMTYTDEIGTGGIVYTIVTKPVETRKTGVFTGKLTMTMPAGNTFSSKVDCTVVENL